MTREEKDAIVGRAFREAREAKEEIAIIRMKCLEMSKSLLQVVKMLTPNEAPSLHLKSPNSSKSDPGFSDSNSISYPSFEDLNVLKQEYQAAKDNLVSAQAALDECG